MATLQASTHISYSASSSSSSSYRRVIKANLYTPQLKKSYPSFSQHQVREFIDHEKKIQDGIKIITQNRKTGTNNTRNETTTASKVVEELYAIMAVVADRAEMHKNIGAQRDNWNHLLLNSVNGMTVTAATMTGLAAVTGVGAPLLALKLSSALLYVAATGVLMAMNKIQPSQLAEEQRNASRLFKQLHGEIKCIVAFKKSSHDDAKDVMEKVLALDRAYPLPLLGAMLEKFPKKVEPAVWWPKHLESQFNHDAKNALGKNGWSEKLEEEMREVVGVLKRKDTADYVRLSKLVLKVNKILAICGPLLTGLAAVGSAFVGSQWQGSWAAFMGIVFGTLATVVNTLEHGGQVGMVFEMYRSSAGFYRLMEESIESTLHEREDRRENGELFEAKLALELGRNVSELRDFARASSRNSEAKQEFASKLF